MAKVAAVPAPGDEAPATEKKSKLKLVIIALAVFVLLSGGAAAYFLFLAPAGSEASTEEAVHEPLPPPVFSVLDPFVVNLAQPDQNRYLQIGITYELTGPAAADEIKNFTPIIRSRILLVLSGKNIESLTNIQGKQRLMDELVDLARVTINGPADDPTKGVRDVHFSSFVIQ